MNPFKKNHATKEQRQEQKRREELVKNLYQLLVENCANAQDLKTRCEIVNEMINSEGAKQLEEYKRKIGDMQFSYLNLKAQDGKGKEVEQKIIDFLVDEKISTAQTILQTWIVSVDAFMRKEMLERKADSLKIEFK